MKTISKSGKYVRSKSKYTGTMISMDHPIYKPEADRYVLVRKILALSPAPLSHVITRIAITLLVSLIYITRRSLEHKYGILNSRFALEHRSYATPDLGRIDVWQLDI